MIKLKDLLKESYVWERKFGEKLPTLADVQKKKLKEEINKLTEKLSKSEIKKMRDKFNKTGKLPPHLKKLADLMDKYKEVEDIVVPGLEWMNDIPEGVVKKETQQLNEDDFASKALDILHCAREDLDTEISKLTKILKQQDKMRKTSNLAKFNTIYRKYIDGFYKAALKIASDVKD